MKGLLNPWRTNKEKGFLDFFSDAKRNIYLAETKSLFHVSNTYQYLESHLVKWGYLGGEVLAWPKMDGG